MFCDSTVCITMFQAKAQKIVPVPAISVQVPTSEATSTGQFIQSIDEMHNLGPSSVLVGIVIKYRLLEVYVCIHLTQHWVKCCLSWFFSKKTKYLYLKIFRRRWRKKRRLRRRMRRRRNRTGEGERRRRNKLTQNVFLRSDFSCDRNMCVYSLDST